MFVLNILENGVEGKKFEYQKNQPNNIKKIYFLNNIVADKSFKKNERLHYLKKLNRIGLTFYIVTEKDVENITQTQWDELYNSLSTKNKKILLKISNSSKYIKFNKTKKIYKNNKLTNNKTKKYN
jgi:hypothetical protein